MVANEYKSQALKVTEGEENDEFLITRLGHVVPAINILNVYGGIENRMTKQEVTENWVRIKKEISKISQREEALVLIGDCNRAIGNDRLGVKGNHSNISHGGSMIRELLEDEEYFLANSLEIAQGGPWTWVSRADRTVKSCLDLVILSSNLKPYVSKVMMDSEQKLCAKKVGITKGKEKVTKSDY